MRIPVFSENIKSLLGQSWWLSSPPSQEHISRLESEGCLLLIAKILASRGVNDAQTFLYGRMKEVLPDPIVLTGMGKALKVILPLIIKKKTIVLFGDYDVDGMAGCAMFQRYLEALDVPVESFIPERVDGYGPSAKTLESLIKKNPMASLLVTIDCGSSEQNLLGSLDIPVLILDHHPVEALYDTQNTMIMLNPNNKEDQSHLGALSACGVVWMFLVALNRELREKGFFQKMLEPDLLQWTDLLCLGLLCDVSPMTSLNRVLCALGLKQLEKRIHRGLKMLLDAGKVFHWPTSRDVVFALGPLLNAASRMGCAVDAYGVLLGKEREEEMDNLVQRLVVANQKRKNIQHDMMEEALGWIVKKYPPPHPKVMVIPLERGRHEVAGVIAGRLTQRYHRSVIALAPSGDGMYQGSGRAPLGMDLGKAIKEAHSKRLCMGGGHARAVGLQVEKENIQALEVSLSHSFQHIVLPEPSITCDIFLEEDWDISLYDSLQVLEPYGEGHLPPLFLLSNVTIVRWREFSDVHISLDCLTEKDYPFQTTLFHATTSPLRNIVQKDIVHMVGQCARPFREKACFILEDALDASSSLALMRPSSIG